MKKTILFLSCLALLMAGCNKVETEKAPAEETSMDSPRHLTVDISVNYASETRSVKTGWNVGDVVYVVFDHFFTEKLDVRPAPAYYMTLTYNGASWKSAFSDPALEDYLLGQTSGKLAAVYSSAQVPELEYLYSTPNTQPAIRVKNVGYTGFHLTASEVDYSVANGKLTASLPMALNDNDIYLSIAGLSGDKNRYSLKCDLFACDYFIRFRCYSDGSTYYGPPKAYMNQTDYGYLMKAAQIGDTNEYCFCGYLNPDVKGVETDYVIQIIDNKGTPDDDTDDLIYTLNKTATLSGKEAIELPPLSSPKWASSNVNGTRGTLNGHEWVMMADGKKWATMNVGAASETDPGYYSDWWGVSKYFVLDYDHWTGWAQQSYYEWQALYQSTNHTITKKYKTVDGQQVFAGVELVVKEGKCKGNRLFLPAAGYEEVIDGVPVIIDPNRGYYWTTWYSIGDEGEFALEILLDPANDNPFGLARTEDRSIYIPVSSNTHLLSRLFVKE